MKVELCIVFAIPHIMENIVKMVFMQIAKDKKTYKFFIISAHQDLASSKVYFLIGLQLVSINLFDTLNQIDQFENALNRLLFM